MFNNFGQYPTYPAVSSYSSIAGQLNNPQQNTYYPNFQPQLQNPSPQSNITFVNGIEGAKAFQMSPNSSVLLMDSDNSKFYVKSTDNLGVAKISSYTFAEDDISSGSKTSQNNNAEDVTKRNEEYDSILSKLSELEVKVSELSSKLTDIL